MVNLAPSRDMSTPLLIVKQVTEVVNNSAVLQADDELVFWMDPEETWMCEYGLLIDSGTTPDFKASFSVIALGVWDYYMPATFAATATIQTGSAGIALVDGQGAGTHFLQMIWVIFRGGLTAGNAVLQWAQNTANGSDTKVLAGSYLKATRLKPTGGVQPVFPP